MRHSIFAALCLSIAACHASGGSHATHEKHASEEDTMLAASSAAIARAPAKAASSTLAPVSADSYACRRCGRVLFGADEVIETRPLWDLGEERNEVHVLKSASGLPGLRRYDASLHEGWYCCRFALMRMIFDKFGTGDHLLAYTGDVVRVPAGSAPRPEGGAHPGQTRVTAAEFDSVVGTDHGDHLSVVKLSATWCPPCRLVDAAIARIDAAGDLPDVRFYEADVDAEPELGERFAVLSLPTLKLYYRGVPLEVRSARVASAGGALVGGISTQALRDVTAAVLRAAREGQTRIDVP